MADEDIQGIQSDEAREIPAFARKVRSRNDGWCSSVRGILPGVPVRKRCTTGKARTVSRDRREPLMEAMREKRRSEEGKRIYTQRGYTVGPVFGDIKWNSRKTSMDLRGSVKVRGEFSLLCLVHNVKKITKRVLEGTVSLSGKYDQPIEEAVPGYGEEQLTLVGAAV